MASSILDLPIEILGRIFTIGCEMTIPTDTIDLVSPHPFASRFNYRNKRRMKGFTLLCALVCSKWYNITRFEGYRHLWISRLRISEWDGASIEKEFGQYVQDLKQVNGEDLDLYWGLACNEHHRGHVNGEVVVRIFLHAMNMTLPYRHSIRRLIAVLESPLALRCMLSFISDSPPAKSLMWFGIGSFWLGSTFTFPREVSSEEDTGLIDRRRLQNEVRALYEFPSSSIRCDLTHVMHSLGHVGIYDVAVHQIVLPNALTSLDLKRMSTFDFPLDWSIVKGLLDQCQGLTKLDLDLFYTTNFPSYAPTQNQRERGSYKLKLLSVCARVQDCYTLLLWFPFPELTEFLFQYINEEDEKTRVYHEANTPGLQYDQLKTLVVRRPCGFETEWFSTWTLPNLERLRLVTEIFGFGRSENTTVPILFTAPKKLEIEGYNDDHMLRLFSYLDTEAVSEMKIAQFAAALALGPDEERPDTKIPLPNLNHLALSNAYARELIGGNLVIAPDNLRTVELSPDLESGLWDPGLMDHLKRICGKVTDLKLKMVEPKSIGTKINPLSVFPSVERLTIFIDIGCMESTLMSWFMPGKQGADEPLEEPLDQLQTLRLEANLEKRSSLASKYDLMRDANIWLERILQSRRERGLRPMEDARVEANWGDAGCWSQ